MSVCFSIYKIDNNGTEELNLTYYNALSRCLKRNNLYKQVKKLNIENKVIKVNEIAYRQGFFMKKRFYNKVMPIYICRTKKEMERFFYKYVDMKSKRAKECFDTFMKVFEDDMIFRCAW